MKKQIPDINNIFQLDGRVPLLKAIPFGLQHILAKFVANLTPIAIIAAAAGHSQGGRSAVNAAVADSRIDCVLSLAGSSYTSEAKKLNTPAFFIGGSLDSIVAAAIWVKPAYKNAKGPAVYANLKNALHTRCCTNASDYAGYAVDWFDAWLKGDEDAMKVFKAGGALSRDRAWKDFATKNF